jgi:hypothetical protein
MQTEFKIDTMFKSYKILKLNILFFFYERERESELHAGEWADVSPPSVQPCFEKKWKAVEIAFPKKENFRMSEN